MNGCELAKILGSKRKRVNGVPGCLLVPFNSEGGISKGMARSSMSRMACYVGIGVKADLRTRWGDTDFLVSVAVNKR